MTKFINLFTIFWIVNTSSGQTTDTTSLLFKFAGKQLPISIIESKFKKKSTTKSPLLLFLHGAGERGSDNKLQLIGGIPKIVKFLNSESFSSWIIIAPQCPKDQKWVNTDWTKSSHRMSDSMTWPLHATMIFLDSLLLNNSDIDKSRIYVSGLSMGGFGTWELLQRYADKFAAAIPVCGGGDSSLANHILNISVWAFHGQKDRVVPVSRTIDMISKMKYRNNDVKMTIYPNHGHYIWDKVYGNKEILKWFFSKRKNH